VRGRRANFLSKLRLFPSVSQVEVAVTKANCYEPPFSADRDGLRPALDCPNAL
jgi:hypothetical protein